MRYRQLSPTGDYQFGSSALFFLVDSPAAVAQAVQTTLKLWMGEWYLDTTAGTPYLENILGYHSQAEADAAIQNTINSVVVILSSTNVPTGFTAGQSVAGVSGIVNFQSSINTTSRKYSASMTLNTIYGPTALQIANYPNF